MEHSVQINGATSIIDSVVKQGSINLAFESQRKAIPKAKFIGLSSVDSER